MTTIQTGFRLSSPSGPQFVDVWSRTARRYRVRAVLMLLVLAILFAGLCCFSFWLRTGVYLPWEYPGYMEILRRSFAPVGGGQVTLSNFLSAPIPVPEVPIHAIIMGLQFASLTSVPILVGILYRMPFAMIFAAMVIFLAAMPWLGVSIMIGCALGCIGPFRFSFRYASALIGLIPITVYFVLATWEPSGAPSKMIYQQALLYAPWVLALLGYCVICAVALAFAKLIDYRPGGIPPVLAMLFVAPVILFHTQVGRDELEYRLLEFATKPGSSSVFAAVDLGAIARPIALKKWQSSHDEPFDDIYKRELTQVERDVALQVEADRAHIASQCDEFIEDFPQSRYVPNVLFLKGRALDARLHEVALRRDHRAEFHFDCPSRASLRTWQSLVQRYPEDSLSSVALYKLAILDARDGKLDASIAALDMLIHQFDVARVTTQPADTVANPVRLVFKRSPASSKLGLDMRVLVSQASRLREMLMACRQDDPKPLSALFGTRTRGEDELVLPVQVVMWLIEPDPHYMKNLQGIVRCFKGSEAAGYVRVWLALQEPEIKQRMKRLREAAKSLAGRPSGAIAEFYLGDALQEAASLDEAKNRFETLAKGYPDSYWTQVAKHRLMSLALLQHAMAE